MAKRIAGSSVNWAAIAERVPANQRIQFNAFKSRSDKYLRAVMANPESSPKIDWAAYKKNIAAASFVDTFQKQYEALKVPYPTDNVSSQIDAQAKEVIIDVISCNHRRCHKIVYFIDRCRDSKVCPRIQCSY